MPQLILWTLVILGCGIATFFARVYEPAAFEGLGLLTLVLTCFVAGVQWHSSLARLLFLAATFCSGFGLAMVRSHRAAGPMIDGCICSGGWAGFLAYTGWKMMRPPVHRPRPFTLPPIGS